MKQSPELNLNSEDFLPLLSSNKPDVPENEKKKKSPSISKSEDETQSLEKNAAFELPLPDALSSTSMRTDNDASGSTSQPHLQKLNKKGSNSQEDSKEIDILSISSIGENESHSMENINAPSESWPDLFPDSNAHEIPAEQYQRTENELSDAKPGIAPIFESLPLFTEATRKRIAAEKKLAQRDPDKIHYWGSILNGDEYKIPEAIQKKILPHSKALDAQEASYEACSIINRSWAADHLGKSKEELQQDWPTIREELSIKHEVADDEEEIYLALSDDHLRQKHKEAVHRIYEQSFLAGLFNIEQPELREEKEDLLPEQQDSALRLSRHSFEEGRAKRALFTPLAQKLAKGLSHILHQERGVDSVPEQWGNYLALEDAEEQLSELSDEERQIIYHLTAEIRKKSPDAHESATEGVWGMSMRSLNRSLYNIGHDVGSFTKRIAATSLHSLGKNIDEHLGTEFQEQSAKMDINLRTREEIRRLAHDQLAPLQLPEGNDFIEQSMIDIAAAAPYVALSFTGIGGFGTLMSSGMGRSIEEARQRNPEGDIELQTAAGIIGGAIQESIYFGMNRIGGRMLERTMGNFLKARGQGAAGYSLAGLKTVAALGVDSVKLLAASKFGQTMELTSQEIAARFDNTASRIDWQAFGNNIGDIELSMREAAANLPFILIGAGRAALRHFKSPAHIVGDLQMLREWGLSKKSIENIMRQDNIEAQGDFLQQALRNSKRWGGLNFLIDAMRSLRLLHSDKFQKFDNEQIVRDFLQMPARNRDTSRNPIKKTEKNDTEGLSRLAEKFELKNAAFRRGKALQCYDLLWQKSNLEKYIPGDPLSMSLEQRWLHIQRGMEKKNEQYLHEISLKEQVIPLGMRRSSIYIPHAEEARMILLRDRTIEIKDLSYQSVLNQMDLVMLQKQSESSEALIDRSEKRSRLSRFRVARSCMLRMLGKPREANYKQFCDDIMLTFRNFRNHTFGNNWLKGIDSKLIRELGKLEALPNHIQRNKKPIPVEFYHAKHISLGTLAAIETLYELIPMTDDYHRSMLRGMSPEQAFSHILLRELELDPSEFPGYPIEQIEASAKNLNLQKIATQNKRNYEIFEKSTGFELEMQAGMDHGNYWRTTLPNGQKTAWHNNKQDAINDLVYSNTQYFRAFAEDQSNQFHHAEGRKNFNITEESSPTYQDSYSGFDELCTRAVHDLFAQMSSRTNSSPEGFEITRLHKRLRYVSAQEVLDSRLLDPSSPSKERMQINEFSVTNPHGVSMALAQNYWKRLLDTGIVKDTEALDFLQQIGMINAKKYDSIMQKELIDKKKQYTHYLGDSRDFLPNIRMRKNVISQLLATLSGDYMNLTIDHPHTPESVKMWYRLAPLCPESLFPVKKRFITIGRDRKNLISWSNRMMSKRLQERANWTQRLRKQLPSIQAHQYFTHLEESLGRNEIISKEKIWAAMFINPKKPLPPYIELWQLLSAPKYTWDRLSKKRKESLRDSFNFNSSKQSPLLAEHMESHLMGIDQGINLIDNLVRKYPELHELTEAPNERGKVRRLSILPTQYDTLSIREKKLIPTRWNPRKVTRSRYKLSDNEQLPEKMQQDPLVIPALQFMDRMRHFIAGRAYESPAGIIFRGKSYGVDHENIPGLDANWKSQYPLKHILTGLEEIDNLCKRGNLDSIRLLDIKFFPMEKDLDLSPLKRISVYRDSNNLSDTIRLMPGMHNSPLESTRGPYVIRQRNGVYYDKGRAIRDMSEMHLSIQSMENFRLYKLRDHSVKTQRALSTINNHHLIDSLFETKLYPSDESELDVTHAEQLELLMRLSEDSGLSDEIEKVGVFQLSPPQLSLLSVIQQLIHLNYSSNDHKKYEQWKQYSMGLQKNKRRLEHMKLSIFDMLEKKQRAYEEHYRQMIKTGEIPAKNQPGRKAGDPMTPFFSDYKFIY